MPSSLEEISETVWQQVLWHGFSISGIHIWPAQQKQSSIYTVVILCSGHIVYAVCSKWNSVHVDKVMIGNIMLQIPGINMMNAIRDMMCGDMITGLLRLMEAIILAVAIAAGFALAIICFAK